MNSIIKYVFMVAFAAACNGLLSIIFKFALNDHVNTSYLLLIGATIAVIFFALIIFIKKNVYFNLRQCLPLVIVGLFLGATAFTFSKAVENLSASMAVLLQFQFTWIAIVINAVYCRQIPSKTKVFAIVLILIGTVFATNIIGSGEAIHLSIVGVVFGLLCASCFGFYIFANEHIQADLHWSLRAFYIMVGSLIFTIIITVPDIMSNPQIEGQASLAITLTHSSILALFGYCIPIVFFAIGIPKVGATISAMLSALELPVAIIAAMFLLHESVSILQWVGVILIVISLLIREPKKATH
ncbi:EamA family transporter [Zophobihabitans entericus]|uniref:DMT family transporter n=1 Tax=Zophobihabitans entericus TaxID=1635327 RepID=A0A6G9I8I6_9GAMM|nr:DMT family transporter [Zophobihabitans entericus]QIQ20525.1 DMT family transporter [Zophobihabitans entericus]